eukprot:scaffold78543_cov45-Phaeocystis_antarctica.AAC.1
MRGGAWRARWGAAPLGAGLEAQVQREHAPHRVLVERCAREPRGRHHTAPPPPLVRRRGAPHARLHVEAPRER